MSGEFYFEHGVELGERADQVSDGHEGCHIVSLMSLLEVAEEVDERLRFPFGEHFARQVNDVNAHSFKQKRTYF